jgi:hypothetical protein
MGNGSKARMKLKPHHRKAARLKLSSRPSQEIKPFAVNLSQYRRAQPAIPPDAPFFRQQARSEKDKTYQQTPRLFSNDAKYVTL